MATYQSNDVTSPIIVGLFQSDTPDPSIHIDAVSHMAEGAGRYVRLSDTPAIRALINDPILRALPDQTISLQQLIDDYGYHVLPTDPADTKAFQFGFRQYYVDITSSDYGQRAMVQGSEVYRTTKNWGQSRHN
jgi:hypothetical protein